MQHLPSPSSTLIHRQHIEFALSNKYQQVCTQSHHLLETVSQQLMQLWKDCCSKAWQTLLTLYRSSSSKTDAAASWASSLASDEDAITCCLNLAGSSPKQSARWAASVPSMGAHSLDTTGWTCAHTQTNPLIILANIQLVACVVESPCVSLRFAAC